MSMSKRIFLFVTVNILIVVTMSVIFSLLGVQPYLTARGINYFNLLIFCSLWGFGGAFISLALSRVMAKWMMGVKIIDAETASPEMRNLVSRVYGFARNAGLQKMPQVGYYESDDLNAFATGPSKNRSLVAVSTGLLQNMNQNEVNGVLAHEVSHIANGDMVTMTLIQGVVNAFVLFLARIAGFFVSLLVDDEKRHVVQFVVVIILDILLGILGALVVASFSRRREFRADAGSAGLTGKHNMIAALEKLKSSNGSAMSNAQPSIASLKISGKTGGFMRLIATHPDIDDRIRRLQQC